MKQYLVRYIRLEGNTHYGFKRIYYGEETLEAENIVKAQTVASEHAKALGEHIRADTITELSRLTHEKRSE